MTVLSVKRGADPDILKIGLSDGSLFYIRPSYISHPMISRLDSLLLQNNGSGLEISYEEQELLLFASECFQLERKALQLIGRAEQTRQGLFQKLKRHGYSEKAIHAVLDRLESLDLINDRRFAAAWIHTQLALHTIKSAYQLIFHLMQRGVDAQIADELVKSFYPAELEKEAIKGYLRKGRFNVEELTPLVLKQILQKARFSKKSIRLFLDENIQK